MKYLRIKPEYDNKVINENFDILIGRELLTIKEFERLNIPLKFRYKCADLVEVKKSNVYWFSGARFCDDEDIIYSHNIDDTIDFNFITNQNILI